MCRRSISLRTLDEDYVSKALVFLIVLCSVRRRIGEYISLEMLVSEQLDFNVLSTALGIKKRKTINRCSCVTATDTKFFCIQLPAPSVHPNQGANQLQRVESDPRRARR